MPLSSLSPERVKRNDKTGEVAVFVDGGWEYFKSDRAAAEGLMLTAGSGVNPETAEEAKGLLSELSSTAKFIGSAALPMIGGAVGGMAGTALMPGLGTAAGMGAGSALGTLASQKLGLEPESGTGIAVSGLVGAASPLASKAVGAIPKFLPGANLAQVDDAARQAPGFLKKFVAEKASALWDLFRETNKGMVIPDLPKTTAAIASLGDETAKAIRGLPGVSKIRSLLHGLEEGVKHGKLNDVRALDVNIKLIGRAVGKMEREGGVELGAFKKVLASLYDDLENAPLSAYRAESVALRKAAVQASKRELALEELQETVTGAIKEVAGADNLMTINASSVLNRVSALTNPSSRVYDKNFATGLSKELPEITKWLRDINKIPTVSGKGGTLVIQGLTAGAGATIAGTPGAVVGAMLGAQIPEHVFASMVSPAGRQILLEAIKLGDQVGRSAISAHVVNAAGQFGRSWLTSQESE